MPNADTFSMTPVARLIGKWQKELPHGAVTIDPFARNAKFAQITNDINPDTLADYHMDARAFLTILREQHEGRVGMALLDPPYSPRQISENYKAAGLSCGMADTQNAKLYKEVKDALVPLLAKGAIVISFGWNSGGMGESRGLVPVEYLLLNHGGAHNDTICVVERRQ